MARTGKVPIKPAKPRKSSEGINIAPPAKKPLDGYDRGEFEVHLERANSLINYLKSEVARLKTEVSELKSYKKWAEARITQISQEEERR
jgi:hypothetical protein